MGPASTDTAFVGSVPELYDTRLVPLIFQPYADDLARRAAALRPATVLETAAGTGVVTRALARALPAGTRLIATDLNQPMLDRAAAVGTDQPVQWRQADAQALPFDDASVDLVVCQFGAMFFPDKPAAYAEARRVLKPGGTLLFNVWDTIEHNELAHEVTAALAALFPADPPRFLARTPHGHGDPDALRRDLAAAGFTAPAQIERVMARSAAPSAQWPALAYCQGTPLAGEITARGGDVAVATEAATRAIAARFGHGPINAKIQALVVSVAR